MNSFSCQTEIHANCGMTGCQCTCHQQKESLTAPATPKAPVIEMPGLGSASQQQYAKQARDQAEKQELFDFMSTLGSFRTWAGWDADNEYYVRIQTALGTFVGADLRDVLRQVKDCREKGHSDDRAVMHLPTIIMGYER